MKNVLFIIFCAFTLFLAIYYYQKYTTTQQALELANRRILDRDSEIYRLQKRVSIIGNSNSAASTQTNNSNSVLGKLSAADINKLKANGLQNPESDLEASLLNNQKAVLSQKGILGGTMAIRDIQILNDRYALAYFEDGHRGGYLVLRYQLSSGGKIAWTVLDSYLI